MSTRHSWQALTWLEHVAVVCTLCQRVVTCVNFSHGCLRRASVALPQYNFDFNIAEEFETVDKVFGLADNADVVRTTAVDGMWDDRGHVLLGIQLHTRRLVSHAQFVCR